MTAPVEKFIRQILSKHAQDGLEAISGASNTAGSDVLAVTVVLPSFGTNEHPLYEYGLALRDESGNCNSIRSRQRYELNLTQLHDRLAILQRFIDALRNEQSIVELTIQRQSVPSE